MPDSAPEGYNNKKFAESCCDADLNKHPVYKKLVPLSLLQRYIRMGLTILYGILSIIIMLM